MCCNRDDDDHYKRRQNHQHREDDGSCGKTGAAVRILGGSIATPGAWGWAASLREHFSAVLLGSVRKNFRFVGRRRRFRLSLLGHVRIRQIGQITLAAMVETKDELH